MKRIISVLSLLIFFLFINCGPKKKKASLFPFLTVINEERTSNLDDKFELPLAPSKYLNSENNLFVIKPSSNNKFTILPENINSSEENIYGSVDLIAEPEDFIYKNNSKINIDLVIKDKNQDPIPKVLIQVHSFQNDVKSLIFSSMSNKNGRIKGILQSEFSSSHLEVSFLNLQNIDPIPIPFFVPSNKLEEKENFTTRKIVGIQLPILKPKFTGGLDKDGDGVVDEFDNYPSNPDKSFTIRFPPQNKQTIAFEDLYPLPSENSYNSYIIQYHFEKDLNSQGKIKEIRGEFTHVSKGPGYKHSLYLKFPNFYQDCINKEPSNIASTPDEMNNCDESQSLSLDVSFETEILNSEDKTLGIGIKRKNATYNQLRNGFEILGDSSKTILASNSEKGKEFRKGYTAKVKFTFNKPISDTLLGEYPFDLFIKIINKKIDNRYPDEAPRTAGRTQNYYEIHLPGKYYNSEGKDLYLDNSNNPWALVIPGEWEWPLEGREFNLLGKKSPYPDYSKWVQAKGQGYNDWYLNPVKKYAFNLPEGPNSSLLAFLKEADSIGLGLSMAIISVSIFILILRKRFIRE